MKIINLLFTFLVFISSSNLFSQANEDQIKDIRKKYRIIEGTILKKKTTKQYFEYRCDENNEMGTVWFIYSNKELRKIEINSILNGENSQITMYYFWNNQLFFAYHQSVAPQYVDDTEMIYHYKEKRIYFDNEKPFRCHEKSYKNSTKNEKTINSEDVANAEVNCTDIEFINENLKIVQQYKDLKTEISLCIW